MECGYSITSLARARIDDGIVRSRPFAAIRLTTSLTGCGKSRLFGPDIGVKSASRDEMRGTSDARVGREERGALQLCELRGAGLKGSSIAAEPAGCGRGVGGSVSGIRA